MPLLGAAFFDRTALKVAYDLIGRRLNWKAVTKLNRASSPRLC